MYVKRVLCALIVLAFASQCFIYPSALGTKALSAVLLDKLTGEVIYQKKANERLSIASTTKIMSAIVVLENADLDAIHTVTYAEASVEGSSLGIRAGDRISIKNLLYGLMLVSGNDASYALADATAGSVEAFVILMNNKAKELGLKNTHFTNPAGLSDDEHYCSAYDLARITAYALDNALFCNLCSLSEYEISFISPQKSVHLYNHNRLLRTYDGCIGVKTGFTERAGRCLVSAAERKGQTLIAVTLNDGDDWKDHKKLLDYGFLLSAKYIADFSKIKINVVGGTKKIIGVSAKYEVYVPKKCIPKIVSVICADNHFLYAPIRKNDRIAKARIIYNSKLLKQINLSATENIDFKFNH